MSTTERIELFKISRQTARPTEPLIFKMRSEFRRSAVIALFGMALILAVARAIQRFMPGQAWGRIIPVLLISLGLLAILRWRICVDARGIARRRLVGWDLWPWEAFAQGEVLDSEAESTSYVLPRKPFWSRKLDLGLLEDADREQVETIIEGCWRRACNRAARGAGA